MQHQHTHPLAGRSPQTPTAATLNKIAAGVFFCFSSGIRTNEGFFRLGWGGATLGSKAPFSPPKGSDSASHRRVARVWVFILTFPEVLSHVPIYNNRPLIVYRNNHTVTRRAESRSLLQPFFFFLFSFLMLGLVSPLSSDSLQEDDDAAASRPAADWLKRAGVGCVAGGRE